MECSDVVVM